jgi:thiol-disulfide isomerase/thioredoxin
MRKHPILVAASAFFWAILWAIWATAQAQTQDPVQNGTQPAPKTATQSSTSQPQTTDSTDQPMSVADLARAARAKRQQTEPKPIAHIAKVLDDDNMPRGVYPAEPIPVRSVAGLHSADSPTSSESSFHEYRGKVILLDFWASWCGPCRSSLPSVKRLQAVYGTSDFVVISVSEDDDEAAWHTFVSANQMKWPQRLDADGSLQNKYGVDALPTYVLIGRDGNVVQTYVGEAPAESIVERIGPDLKATLAGK